MTFDETPTLRDLGPLALALSKAQAAFPPIPRDREVEVQTRTGGKYRFKYAPLDTILAAVRGPLSDNGLAIAQLLDGHDLVTLLMHESGAVLSARIGLQGGDTVQALGSSITYLRRYSLQAMLGVAAEEDDDGQGATAGQQAPAARPARPPLSAVVSDRLSKPRGDNPESGSATNTAPDSPVAFRGSRRLPETQEEPAPAPDEPVDLAAVAEAVFADVKAPSITMSDFKTKMKEAHVLSGQVTAIAKKRLGYDGMVSEMSDEDRYRLWEAVVADLASTTN
jgi:hypothetical protein